MDCLLCHSSLVTQKQDAFECTCCGLVFKNPASFLSSQDDFIRYSQHQNNHQDQGYRDFLNKLIDPLASFLNDSFVSLDYGCGPGPTLSILLKEKGGVVFGAIYILWATYKILFGPLDDPENQKLSGLNKFEVIQLTVLSIKSSLLSSI